MPTFDSLRSEYAALWSRMAILPERAAAVDAAANKLIARKARYRAVAEQTGVPWFVIAVLHERESSADFTTHLHNGDPLSARTRLLPAGRPARGQPPFTWEESAIDALTMHDLHQVAGWSIERIAYECVRYNGSGYRNHAVPSAYLWSFSNLYRGGKYVADGVWSPTAQDKQCGCMPLIARLAEFDGSVRFGAGLPRAAAPASGDDDLAARIVRAMDAAGHRVDRGPGELNIVYVEGLNADGTANDNAPNRFNDLRCVIGFADSVSRPSAFFTSAFTRVCNATTRESRDPGAQLSEPSAPGACPGPDPGSRLGATARSRASSTQEESAPAGTRVPKLLGKWE